MAFHIYPSFAISLVRVNIYSKLRRWGQDLITGIFFKKNLPARTRSSGSRVHRINLTLPPQHKLKPYCIFMEFFTLKDFNLKNKTVAVRVDLNLPYDSRNKRLSENARLKAHIETIKKLHEEGAKIVLLAHQGRKGKDDFISLEKHTELLNKYLDSVGFLEFREELKRIKEMKAGDIILLDNTRFYEDEKIEKNIEEHSESELVKSLAPLIDYFVLDAFSVVHRCHASVVGFSRLKPCIAGHVFERELKELQKFSKKLESSKSCFILGGAKPKEPIKLMKRWGEKDIVFPVTGVISLLFLIAKGYDLGHTEKFLHDKGYIQYLDEAKILLEKLGKKIILPVDLAIENENNRVEISVEELPSEKQILDIGKETIKNYNKIVQDSEFVCVKGPAGVYENENFQLGTYDIFSMLGENSLVGGGNTTDALGKLGIDFNKLGYVSLGGGSFVDFLVGKKLPGIKALEKSFEKFKD